MHTITIPLSDDRLTRLQEMAIRFGGRPEHLPIPIWRIGKTEDTRWLKLSIFGLGAMAQCCLATGIASPSGTG
jgi:hypothetical protein